MERGLESLLMLDALAAIYRLERPTAPRFADGDAEDRYYRSHEPRRWRWSALASLTAIVGLVVLAFDVLPR